MVCKRISETDVIASNMYMDKSRKYARVSYDPCAGDLLLSDDGVRKIYDYAKTLHVDPKSTLSFGNSYISVRCTKDDAERLAEYIHMIACNELLEYANMSISDFNKTAVKRLQERRAGKVSRNKSQNTCYSYAAFRMTDYHRFPD